MGRKRKISGNSRYQPVLRSINSHLRNGKRIPSYQAHRWMCKSRTVILPEHGTPTNVEQMADYIEARAKYSRIAGNNEADAELHATLDVAARQTGFLIQGGAEQQGDYLVKHKSKKK